MRLGTARSQSGFTLAEMMVTCAVAVILAAIAFPSYRTIIRAARLITQMYDFDAALNLTRSEAIKRGIPVTICPSTDQASCGASGTNWEQGWIVFVDKNSNQTVDAGEEILRSSSALVSGYTLRGTAATTLDSYLTITPKGVPSDTGLAGMFVLCESGQVNPSRAILVSYAGRITMAADDNGVPVGADGNDITTCTP